MGTYGDFWSYVDKGENDEDCWLWNGARQPQGYGVCRHEGKTKRAHRRVYELLVGDIPEGLQLDHLCRVRNCVNPKHLEPVTNAENGRRGIAGQVAKERMLARTHCKNGHEFDRIIHRQSESRKGRVERACSTCQNIAAKKHYQKTKKQTQAIASN